MATDLMPQQSYGNQFIGEKMVREPTIPERINDAAEALVTAHNLLDRLETKGQGAPSSPRPESLVGASAFVSEQAALLVGRLRTLFGE